MKNRIITLLKYGIFLGLGIFLVWWQFSKMTPAQYVQFKFMMPDEWDRTTLKAKFFWMADSSTGDVIWGIAGGPLSNDDRQGVV